MHRYLDIDNGNIYVYFTDNMLEVREYLDAEGKSPYVKSFNRLNVAAAVKVTTAVHRMAQGNFVVA
jgi:hypothetical protein